MHRLLLACLAALLVLAGCADAPETERTVTEATEPATQPPTPRTSEDTPDPGDVAMPAQLDFTLAELSGGQVVGAELAGQHVALWFWTPW